MIPRALALACAAGLTLSAAVSAEVVAQGGKVKSVMPTVQRADAMRLAAAAKGKKPPPPPPAVNGIEYHGGPLMLGKINIYFIWYGSWDGNDAVDILSDEIRSIGGTSWFSINSGYWDKTNKRPANQVVLKASINDDYSRGMALTDDDIEGIVFDAISHKRLPKDTNGIYFVLTSPDVTESAPDGSAAFCSEYCGWHTSDHLDKKSDIKFGFIGGAAGCLNGCARQRTRSVNNNPGADAMASVLAHEISEATTDPDLNAWWHEFTDPDGNPSGEENADMCAWTFGATYHPNDDILLSANVQWGGRDFLVQQNWINAGGGSCGLSP